MDRGALQKPNKGGAAPIGVEWKRSWDDLPRLYSMAYEFTGL